MIEAPRRPHADLLAAEFLIPDWPAPAPVRAAVTLRGGGHSAAPWATFNLGAQVGDDPQRVAANRTLLRTRLALPAPPQWLRQEHGVGVIEARADCRPCAADASFTRTPGVVCAVLTADCLPVLFADRGGTLVAAVHAGWRGLAAGVLQATIGAMDTPPTALMAWLGPAIGPAHFEVGPEVRAAFKSRLADGVGATDIDACFTRSPGRRGHCFADIYRLARLELGRLGVVDVYGGGRCTFSEATAFYSYRRDGVTGRMASLIWLAPG